LVLNLCGIIVIFVRVRFREKTTNVPNLVFKRFNSIIISQFYSRAIFFIIEIVSIRSKSSKKLL
jgi:hypothetical protein